MYPMFREKQNYIESQGRYNWVARPSVIFLQMSLHHSLTLGFALGTLHCGSSKQCLCSSILCRSGQGGRVGVLFEPYHPRSFLLLLKNQSSLNFRSLNCIVYYPSLLQSPIFGSGILAPCHSLHYHGCKNY